MLYNVYQLMEARNINYVKYHPTIHPPFLYRPFFKLEFPQANTMNSVRTSSNGTTPSATDKKVKDIFVIEDDLVISKMLQTILKRRGYKTHPFFDGNEAAKAIETYRPPDLILLDIVLPYIDGYRILEQISLKDDWKEVPTIMITSNSNESNIVRAFEIGADDYITKPIQIDELVVRINRFLR